MMACQFAPKLKALIDNIGENDTNNPYETGTIQAQGCGFRIFENTYFPILNGIVSKISVSDRSNTIPIVESDKNNNIGITEN